eukprot:scaffold1290_cov367-Prasinococcus_capsulatus_cf.AAC.6
MRPSKIISSHLRREATPACASAFARRMPSSSSRLGSPSCCPTLRRRRLRRLPPPPLPAPAPAPPDLRPPPRALHTTMARVVLGRGAGAVAGSGGHRSTRRSPRACAGRLGARRSCCGGCCCCCCCCCCRRGPRRGHAHSAAAATAIGCSCGRCGWQGVERERRSSCSIAALRHSIASATTAGEVAGARWARPPPAAARFAASDRRRAPRAPLLCHSRAARELGRVRSGGRGGGGTACVTLLAR